MICKFLLSLAALFFSLHLYAGEATAIDYEYQGEHGVDFSSMPGGPLKIAAIEDVRESVENDSLTTPAGDVLQLDEALPELIRAALIQAVEAGGGQVVGSDEQLLLDGQLIEASAEQAGGEIEVTLRAKLALSKSGGGELYSTTAFGKADVPETEGLSAAVAASLDKLVNSLLWDDYFLMQVID